MEQPHSTHKISLKMSAALLLITGAVFLFIGTRDTYSLREDDVFSTTTPADTVVATSSATTTLADARTSTHVYPKTIEYPFETFTKKLTFPQLRNIPLKSVETAILEEIDIPAVTHSEINDIQSEEHGIVEMDYSVNYDKNNILSLSIGVDTMGAYPDYFTSNFNFDVRTGKQIKLEDIIAPRKIDALISLLNTKLAANVEDAYKFARVNNPDNREGECTVDTIKEQLPDSVKFDKNAIDMSITSEGIAFYFEYGFAHVVRACQPEQVARMTYKELKEYLKADGLLGAEL
ncbi:MAG: hypothetical protein RL094_588 [Candidatus Parcubacteria bacterium]|jgi:hypothetical protein